MMILKSNGKEPDNTARCSQAGGLSTTRETAVSSPSFAMRPPYRRGGDYLRCGLRLRCDVWRALHLEARRQRRGVSDLAQTLLLAGLERQHGRLRDDARPVAPSPPGLLPAGERHWIRLALEAPMWERLQAEAATTGYSVAQLARQRLGAAVLNAPPDEPESM